MIRARPLSLAAALLAACEHGAPFRPGDYGPDGPFDAAPPLRLTFNPGNDRAPAWLPDGSGILYSTERFDRSDGDDCFALLPPGGGVIHRYLCASTAPDDSINAFREPLLDSAGRLVYVRASVPFSPTQPRPIAPLFQAVVLATVERPNDVRVLRTLPYQAPSESLHQGVSHARWLGEDALVYLATKVAYPRACSSCAPDTLEWGLEIATLDFSNATPIVSVVPGTAGASSVAVGALGEAIYYTRNGDSRVFRYAFATRQTDTVHDFGGAGIARDVALADGRLLAVVGGAVSYFIDPVLGPVQVDNGGLLHLVTLATGSDTVVGDSGARYRRPAWSPAGAHVVVERVEAGGGADLWLLEVP